MDLEKRLMLKLIELAKVGSEFVAICEEVANDESYDLDEGTIERIETLADSILCIESFIKENK